MSHLEALLELAKEVATVAHEGQVDKVGEAYINHPRRVASYCGTIEGKIVGWLHDVVEDTDITYETLRNLGFDEYLLEALRCVTKEKGYDIDEYYARIKANEIAREVKLADLRDNTDETRIPKDYPQDKKDRLKNMLKQYYEHIDFLMN